LSARSICFDFDGTLIDSRHDIAAAVNRLRDRHELEPLSVERVAEEIGSGTRELIEGVFPEEPLNGNIQDVIDGFRKAYLEICTERVEPYPEITPLVEDLSDDNLSIVTNKPLSMTEKILNTLQWDSYFEPVFGPDSFGQGKPHPRPLEAVVRNWSIDPEELVMIGDSWADIRAGNALGCRTVACLYGLGNSDRVLEESPDETVESVEELRALLLEESSP
jgi:phosphoglycolate phosphatase